VPDPVLTRQALSSGALVRSFLTVCLEAVQTLLPNLARGVANGTDSASRGNLAQPTFSFFFLDFLHSCLPRFE
jgi:hypothetical protein